MRGLSQLVRALLPGSGPVAQCPPSIALGATNLLDNLLIDYICCLFSPLHPECRLHKGRNLAFFVIDAST